MDAGRNACRAGKIRGFACVFLALRRVQIIISALSLACKE